MFLFIVIFTLTINYTQQYKLDIDCFNKNNNGIHYKGTLNTTATGIRCIVWKNKHNSNVNYFADHNYCRNPDNSQSPWCYADSTGYPRQFCDIPFCGYLCPDLNPTPHMVELTNLGKHRFGDTVTFRCAAGYVLSGSKSVMCVYVPGDNMGSWDNPQPSCIEDCRSSTTDLQYKGHINITRKGYTCKYWKDVPLYRTEEENYCRTPPGDTDNAGGPWCYTSNRWDRCNVPVCGGKSCRNLTKNHLIPKDGKNIYHYSEAVYVSCETGYHMTGDSTMTCEQSGQWSPTLPTCEGKRCPSLTYHLIPKDGKSVFRYGDTISVSCEPGYRLKGDTILSCKQSGQWNATLPMCEEITCTRMSLSLTDEIVVMKNKNSFNYREMVTMSCKSGLTGTTVTSQCIDVNKWSHKPPLCARITCTTTAFHLTNVNITNSKQSYNFNEEVTMSCNYGFIGETVTARCTDLNTWSKESPTCTRITCTRTSLHLTRNVNVRNNKQSYDFNEEVTMSCKSGFSGKTVTARCTHVNKWSKNSPTCTEITCTQRALHLADSVNVTNGKQSYHFNEKVTMSCKSGFSGETVTARCTDVNTWSENSPTCTRTCPNLNFTPHLSKPRKLDGYRNKDEIHFGCDVGYYLVGSPVLTCLATGRWSSSQPTCKAVECPVLYEAYNITWSPNHTTYRHNDIIHFQCDIGYQLSGPSSLVCQADNHESIGRWSNKQPACVVTEEYRGVSTVVFGVVVALIIVVAIGFIIGLMRFMRRKY